MRTGSGSKYVLPDGGCKTSGGGGGSGVGVGGWGVTGVAVGGCGMGVGVAVGTGVSFPVTLMTKALLSVVRPAVS